MVDNLTLVLLFLVVRIGGLLVLVVRALGVVKGLPGLQLLVWACKVLCFL